MIERFTPSQIHVLHRDGTGLVTAKSVGEISPIKPKHYTRHARRALAEGMLGKAVVVAEGATEVAVLNATAEKLEAQEPSLWPLDLSGVTIFSVDGDGDLPPFGAFFGALGLKTYAFYDSKTRTEQANESLKAAFDLPWETAYKGIEKLLVEEIPANVIWNYLVDAKIRGFTLVPETRPGDEEVKNTALSILKSNKGNAEAAVLLSYCEKDDLPSSVTKFLHQIYEDFPKPKPPPPLTPDHDGADGSGGDDSGPSLEELIG